jgi:hypothetical protein
MKKEITYRVRLKKPIEIYGTEYPIGSELEPNMRLSTSDGWWVVIGHGAGFNIPCDEGELVEYTTTTTIEVESKIIS